MDNNVKVKIDEIQEIVTLLLSNLKERKGNEIELESDFYWDISNDQLYNAYDDPNDLSLGQLSDDLAELNRLVKSKDEAIPYDLKRVAEILKALSIENPTAF